MTCQQESPYDSYEVPERKPQECKIQKSDHPESHGRNEAVKFDREKPDSLWKSKAI